MAAKASAGVPQVTGKRRSEQSWPGASQAGPRGTLWRGLGGKTARTHQHGELQPGDLVDGDHGDGDHVENQQTEMNRQKEFKNGKKYMWPKINFIIITVNM